MSNFGFISKKKIAREIANIYKQHSRTRGTKDEFYSDMGACSALNFLCTKLDIKPVHRNRIGGGTGEMLGGNVNE